MMIKYSENNTTVFDCYLYDDNMMSEIVDILIAERNEKGLKVTRNKESYLHELKAHKRLYKLGYQRHRTRDCDLEENIKAIYRSVYNLIGR